MRETIVSRNDPSNECEQESWSVAVLERREGTLDEGLEGGEQFGT